MNEVKDLGYYERNGGPVYGQGGWPQSWLDEAGNKIKEAMDKGIEEDITKDKGEGKKDIYINCYELKRDETKEHTPEFYKKFMDTWMNGLISTKIEDQKTYHGLSQNAEPTEPTDAYYIQLEPRIKWFKPPLSIKIFKWEINMTWAYKVHKAYLLKDIQPVLPNYNPTKEELKNDTISDSAAKKIMRELAAEDDDDDHSITLEWKATPLHSSKIDKMAEELKKNYENNII